MQSSFMLARSSCSDASPGGWPSVPCSWSTRPPHAGHRSCKPPLLRCTLHTVSAMSFDKHICLCVTTPSDTGNLPSPDVPPAGSRPLEHRRAGQPPCRRGGLAGQDPAARGGASVAEAARGVLRAGAPPHHEHCGRRGEGGASRGRAAFLCATCRMCSPTRFSRGGARSWSRCFSVGPRAAEQSPGRGVRGAGAPGGREGPSDPGTPAAGSPPLSPRGVPRVSVCVHIPCVRGQQPPTPVWTQLVPSAVTSFWIGPPPAVLGVWVSHTEVTGVGASHGVGGFGLGD